MFCGVKTTNESGQELQKSLLETAQELATMFWNFGIKVPNITMPYTMFVAMVTSPFCCLWLRYLTAVLDGVGLPASLQFQRHHTLPALPADLMPPPPLDLHACCHINLSFEAQARRPDVLLNIHKVRDCDLAGGALVTLPWPRAGRRMRSEPHPPSRRVLLLGLWVNIDRKIIYAPTPHLDPYLQLEHELLFPSLCRGGQVVTGPFPQGWEILLQLQPHICLADLQTIPAG